MYPPTVYPRVGGGTADLLVTVHNAMGLSLRGRGNPLRIKLQSDRQRSIPAWAGEPRCNVYADHARTVYPRVGGGTATKSCQPDSNDGLSPRGRGNHMLMWTVGGNEGLSPRGRGNHVDTLYWIRSSGSIPAWAGEPSPASTGSGVTSVYPRVGGGTFTTDSDPKSHLGLSPRGRGNPTHPIQRVLSTLEVCPAHAGVYRVLCGL